MPYSNLTGRSAAPAGAAGIGVYDTDGGRVGHIPLGGLDKAPGEAPTYRFGLISDVHRRTDSDTSTASRAAHLDAALARFAAGGIPLVLVTGDVADTHSTGIFTETAAAVSRAGYAVGSSFLWGWGNHENQGAPEMDARISAFESVCGEGSGRFYTVMHGDDVFAVLHFRKFGNTAGDPCFLDSDLDALETCLRENRGRRIFLVEHALPCTGNSSDLEMSGHAGRYVDTTHWGSGDASTQRFFSLIRDEQRLIWLHGHSHYCFELQDTTQKYGYCALTDRYFGCVSVHVPSVGMLKTDTEQTVDPTGGQAYEVSVYPSGLLFEGLDLTDTAGTGTHFLPSAVFWIPIPVGDGTFAYDVHNDGEELVIDEVPAACLRTDENELILEDANE